MRYELVSTANVRSCNALAAELEQRFDDNEISGLGLICGRPGLGKTMWLESYKARAMEKRDWIRAILVDALPTWTPASMLESLLTELGQQPYQRRTHAMLEQLIDDLGRDPALILMDEIHRIVGNQVLVEVIKHIHDKTSSVIILAGELQADSKFTRYASFYDRLNAGGIVKATENTANDVAEIITKRCELKVAPEVCRSIYNRDGKSIRNVLRRIRNVEEFGRANDLLEMSMKQYRLMLRALSNSEGKILSIVTETPRRPEPPAESTAHESQEVNDSHREAHA